MSKRKMKDVEEMSGNYELKPIGWYKVIVHAVELRYGEDTGNPYGKTDFIIIDGQYKKSYLFRNVALTVKAIGFLKPFLAAIGWDDDDEIEIEDKSQTIKIDEQEWVGKKLQVYVSHKNRQDTGEKQEDVTAYKRLDDADDYELTPDELPPMSESESKSDDEEDEEIPF